MKKYNAAAGIIQSRFRTKQYEKGMIENGYFKLACGTEDWSILNYFNGNSKVVAELLDVYQNHERGNVLFNIDEFTQWIDEHREMLFYGTTPENITSMTRLDHNRSLSILRNHLSAGINSINKFVIWVY